MAGTSEMIAYLGGSTSLIQCSAAQAVLVTSFHACVDVQAASYKTVSRIPLSASR